MAGDKFKDGFPIAVDFVAGEQPTDIKLDGLADQTKNGLDQLEAAVGDIWNQSKALSTGLSNRDLQIANIGRILGPASMLSPQILDGINIVDFEYAVPVGVKEFILPHRPMVGGGNSTIDWNASARFTTEKAGETLLAADGDYFIDYQTGRVFTYTRTVSPDTAKYDYDSVGDSFSNASLNVIPDPNQTTARCTVVDNTGDYTITLPYITYDQDGVLLTDGSNPNHSEAPGVGVHNSQRALLPSFLWGLSVGDVIPAGYVFLYDHDPAQDAIVEGATLRYSNTSEITAENVSLAEGNARYSIITVGSPLTELMYELRKRYRVHIHDGANGEERVAHANLTGNIYEGADTWGAADAPFVEMGYVPSVVDQNDHPQYLMRSGYSAGIDSNNSDNVMRGEIMMGSVAPVGNDFRNLADNSRSIFFGSETGPRLRYNNTYDGLQLATKSLMSDLHVTVGRSSTVDANVGYVGFGNTPSANNIFLNESHGVSKRFEFKEGGSAAVSDIATGRVIANEGYMYMGDRLASGNTYLYAAPLGTTFDMYANDSIHGSFLRVGKIRLYSNVLYFSDDGDEEYIAYDDLNNTFTFVADSAISQSKLEAGVLRTTQSELQMPDGSNRIVRSGTSFYFYASNSYNASRLVTNRVWVNGYELDGGDVNNLHKLRNGTHVGGWHRHSHRYEYCGRSYITVYNNHTTTSRHIGGNLIGASFNGWDLSGWRGGGNDGHIGDNHITEIWWSGSRVYCTTGPSASWNDSGRIWFTYFYASTTNTY